MAVNIPTIQELRDRIKTDVEGKLNISLPTFGKNFLLTWIGVQAAKLKLFYVQLFFVQKNTLPDTADSELKGGTLERWGRIKLNRNPFAATAGVYTLEITGTIGATINSGQTWKSNDDSSNAGKLYVLDNDFELESNPDYITVRALEVGLEGRLVVGDQLTSISPIVNVDRIGEITVEDTIPLSAETIEDYRDKVIEAFRLEPQGGAVGDFRLWAADAQGVRKVYPNAKSGESSNVDLFIEATIDDSTDGKGTPTGTILTDVEAVIELDPDDTLDINVRGRRPLGIHTVYYLPVTPLDVDITILGFVGITDEIKTTIETALTSFLYDVRPFIAGADVLSKKNDVLTINNIAFNIVSVIPQGTYFSSIVLRVNGVNSSVYQFLGGNIPSLNSITYV